MQISPLAGHLVRALAKLVAHACDHALVRICTELGQWLLVVPGCPSGYFKLQLSSMVPEVNF